MKGKRWVIGLMTCFLMFLTGCLSVGSENFYALPQRSEKYRDLQAAVERAMGSGVYAAPVSGSNRQAIQQADLDGDGREEALVFCRIGTEHPLKVLILKRTEEDYRLVCTIEGDGSAFDSVQYAQIDGAPGQELLLSRRISDQVQQSLTVYKLKDNAPVELMSSSYSAYTLVDMDSDNCTDVFLLGTNPEGPVGFADLYRCRDGVMQKDVEANLSTPAESVKRMITGCVSSGVPAVFVASAYDENSLITDVFTLRNNIFANISQNAESGQSSQTVRNYFVYSTDIDNDGVIEMPNTVPLTELPEEKTKLVGLITGRRQEIGWNQGNEQVDFYDMKGIVEELFARLGISKYTVEAGEHFALHPGKTALFKKGRETIAVVGELHPEAAENFGIKQKVYLFEMDVETLMKYTAKNFHFESLPKYPAIARDLAMLVDEEVAAADIERVITKHGGKNFAGVTLFDVYTGKQVAAGKKSLAFNLTFQSKDRTLKDEEADAAFQQILAAVEQQFHAELRA